MSKNLSPTVKCCVCFNRYKSLSRHLKKHNHTARTYKAEFDAPVVSPLTRYKIRFARLRTIQRKRAALNLPPTPGYTKGFYGKKHTPETIEKLRQARIGKKLSEAHKLAISAGLIGHPVSEETKNKLRNVVITDEMRKRRSELQSGEKGSAWKGGVSRHLYFTKGKYRLKKIFGEPLRCFFPGCDKIEGVNVKSLDCHHLDGNHENNPLDGSNWLPLCRRHHMLADGRLNGVPEKEAEAARKAAYRVHKEHMDKNYVGEIITYHE